MSAQKNIETVLTYLAGQGPHLMAEEAVFYDYALPEPIRGAEAIGQMLHDHYNVSFPGAEAQVRRITASESSVVMEFTFRGVNTGPYQGRPPTGREVAVPMCVVYDLEDGKIVEGRLYYDSPQVLG
jgi:steroid delta-isomerase-like uncharacterized protein